MKSRIATLLLLIAACDRAPETDPDAAPAAPPVPAPPTWAVTPTGIGTIQVGWTLSRLNTAVTEQLTVRAPECDHVRPAATPPGVSLMVIHDTVVRIDVDSAGVVTNEGIGIGDPEGRVRSTYGDRVATEPHKYTGPVGHYLVVSSPGDTVHKIIFETDGNVVTRFRAGRLPAVRYVEGCS